MKLPKIQGVQDQNLPKEMAIALKLSISDLRLVKTKCVSDGNNFFTSQKLQVYMCQLFVYKENKLAEMPQFNFTKCMVRNAPFPRYGHFFW